MVDSAVTIKGTKDGLLITLQDGSLEAVVAEMKALLTSRASFFLGGRVALRVGSRPVSAEQLQSIGAALQQAGMTLWAVESDNPVTHVAAHELGLEISLQPTSSAAASVREPTARDELPGLVVRRTLHAGQELHYAGHMAVIGDVNPGAEVTAGGDLIVWGRLRGRVHAGALGDDGAVVCALQLAPSQIRIGSYVAQPPERARLPKHPEMASVQEGRIVVDRWER